MVGSPSTVNLNGNVSKKKYYYFKEKYMKVKFFSSRAPASRRAAGGRGPAGFAESGK
jgi:hypothetical protein